MNKQKAIEALESVIDDFESGFIANPSGRGEQNRERKEKKLRDVLAFLHCGPLPESKTVSQTD